MIGPAVLVAPGAPDRREKAHNEGISCLPRGATWRPRTEHSVALRLLIVMPEHAFLRAWLSSSRAIVSLLGGAVELPGKQEKPKPRDRRRLAGFGGGCLASLAIYLTMVMIYYLTMAIINIFGARLDGSRLDEFAKALAGATVLQLLAAGIIAVTSSRWRRFAAGVAVVSGLGLLIIAFFFVVGLLLSYGFAHTRLDF
jgi:hypothetical protein